MSFFGFGKKKKILDLTKGEGEQESSQEGVKSDEPEIEITDDFPQTPEEKRKKLAKRIIDMTEKIEDVSNQLYHLQQRVEVLEKKSNPEVE